MSEWSKIFRKGILFWMLLQVWVHLSFRVLKKAPLCLPMISILTLTSGSNKVLPSTLIRAKCCTPLSLRQIKMRASFYRRMRAQQLTSGHGKTRTRTHEFVYS
uniref:Uncharacterized protein n=1 Tax=Cacopsylla melanoneura TaxID=428564 RepID=A0A8D8LPK9_9HEMI